MQIRRVEPHEHRVLGDLTLAAYATLFDDLASDGYDAELRDVAFRAAVADVYVAVDDVATVLGGVTFVPDTSNPLAEWGGEHVAGIRMLAVDENARGRGIGEALTRRCIARAHELGCREVVLHSTPEMEAAHRLYARLGFARAPDLDWSVPPVDLLGFRLTL